MPFLKSIQKIPRSQRLINLSKRQGLRHAIFSVKGDKYIGEWSDDKKSGKGRIETTEFDRYEGDWIHNYREGFGILSYLKRNNVYVLEYVGWWRKNKMHGFGVRKYRNGDIYIGNWMRGLRNGYGHMWYENGATFYAGHFRKNKREGLGMFVTANNNRYEGSWKNDMKHGKGKYLHLDSGQIQIGVWNEDICVYSVLKDMQYRQSGIYPTHYPIRKVELMNLESVCGARELHALEEYLDSCETLMEESLENTSLYKL